MKMTFTSTLIASAVALATLTGAAQAKGRLVVYCRPPMKCVRPKPKRLARNMM